MAIVLALLAWVGHSYRARASESPNHLEGVIEYIATWSTGSLGKSGEPFVPFFIALFIFLFALNQFGIFSFKLLGLPIGGSPTARPEHAVPYALLIFVDDPGRRDPKTRARPSSTWLQPVSDPLPSI